MKTIVIGVLASFLVLSGLAFASQSGEEGEEKDSSSMLQEMMKGEEQGEYMAGMMHMMKMMDQCAAMMESAHSVAKDGRKE